MGAAGSVDATGIDTAYRDATLNRQLTIAALVILYWEFIVTLPQEVERYWGERFKISWPTLCFFGCRYLSLVGHIPILVQTIQPMGDESLCVPYTLLCSDWFVEKIHRCRCPKLLTYHQAFIVVGQIFVAVMLNIRTCALYGGGRKIKIGLWTFSITLLALACGAVFSSQAKAPDAPDGIGCNVALSQSEGTHVAIAWGCLLLYDVGIFALTLYKALALRGSSRGLVDVILRDGTMYFALISCGSICTFVTLIAGRPLIKGLTSTLANILSITLISRLMLNLRDPIVMAFTQPTRDTTDVVTSIVIRSPTQWSTRNDTVTAAQEASHSAGKPVNDGQHDLDIELVPRNLWTQEGRPFSLGEDTAVGSPC